jgi:catecholate siderophore receptor
VTVGAQFMRQDNVPDYGVPGAAWRHEPLTPTTVVAAAPVDQSNYYGSRGFDYDKAAQNSVVARIEQDLSPRSTVQNQTRYNSARREAVITSIGNVAAFDPASGLVTLSRQGNERENTILSNQTSLTTRFGTGGLQHAASAGLELTVEEQFAPSLGGVGTRNPVDIFRPNPSDPVSGYDVVRTGAWTKGRTGTAALYLFDTVEFGRRWQVSGGVRVERYDTEYRAVDAAGLVTTDARAQDALVSGKAGVVFKVNDKGSLYVSYGSTVTPPGSANFSLSTQQNNQNNPEVEPQESTNLEAGSKWEIAGGRLLLTGAIFHTKNRNVIYTIDATAVPPLYNQDDGQRVNGIALGMNGRILERWDVNANISYLDTALETQNAANNGNRLTLTPRLSGGIWTTYRLPIRLTLGGGLRLADAVFVNAANTIRTPGYTLLDLLAEFAMTQHTTLRLNVYNATNERYIRSVNNNGGRHNPGTPRAATVALGVRF